jgi:hypothetical protein
MSVRLLGVVAAMAAMGLVACGDDTGGGGGSGGGTGGGATATGTGGTATATGTGGGTTATGTATATRTGTGGGGSTAPCAEACAADAGCDESPANPDGACSECVQAQADMGTDSECAVEGALGPCCQDNSECSEYVTCVLTGGETCDADFPAGGARASECVLNSCGDCGTPG